MDQECAICLEKLYLHEPNEQDIKKNKPDSLVLVTTPCQHTYHKACFEKWLNVSNTCPHCRTVLYEVPMQMQVPVLLPPFDGELQLQWIVREHPGTHGTHGIHGMSNIQMSRDYELRILEHERDTIQNRLVTVVSYMFCLIGTAYCLGDCSGTAGSWMLGGWGS